MVSANILCKKLLNVKDIVVESCAFYDDKDGVHHIRINARPTKRHINDCPYCGKKCSGYDKPSKRNKIWRGLDFGSIVTEIEASTHRVKCPEHGVVTASIPWSYPNSKFTKEFDMTAAWMTKYLPISAIAKFLRIDWQTVGNCINRASNDLEADRSKRLDNLVNIGIDETSYRKGHKYITIIVNHDTNAVVWVANGHGKTVLEQFYKELTPEQLASIKVVTGDGARWITDCVNEFTPDCERCVDPFHVVEWAMEALNEVRIARQREYTEKVSDLKKDNPQKPGRPSSDNSAAAEIKQAGLELQSIKKSKYPLGKASENLTKNQRIQLDIILTHDKQLCLAYTLKESLRHLLKITDVDKASGWIKRWCWWASHSKIPAFKELCQKIKRHKAHILNTIRLGFSNARIEATNNKIKLIIRKAYGFRNLGNMMDMIYLVCSNIDIPLPNRKTSMPQIP